MSYVFFDNCLNATKNTSNQVLKIYAHQGGSTIQSTVECNESPG